MIKTEHGMLCRHGKKRRHNDDEYNVQPRAIHTTQQTCEQRSQALYDTDMQLSMFQNLLDKQNEQINMLNNILNEIKDERKKFENIYKRMLETKKDTLEYNESKNSHNYYS